MGQKSRVFCQLCGPRFVIVNKPRAHGFRNHVLGEHTVSQGKEVGKTRPLMRFSKSVGFALMMHGLGEEASGSMNISASDIESGAHEWSFEIVV